MSKTAVFITIFLLLVGCGRIADEGDSSIGTKSYGKLQFITVKKSRFVANDNIDGGHFQVIVKTVNKPISYERVDLLEDSNHYALIENGKIKDESVISVQKTNNAVKSKILLLLDLSGSILEGGCSDENSNSVCNQLIRSSNEFIDNIIKNGAFEIAIYYFNSKKSILPLSAQTEFPTANLTILKNAVKQLQDPYFVNTYLKGYNSTNLYGAVEQSGEKVCSWTDCENQNGFEIGSVVIFTDGRDLAEIVTKKEMLKSLKDQIQYYTIGIGNADNKTLAEISGENHHFEASQENIQSAFTQTYEEILYNSSFYRINYCPATLEGTIKTKIMFEDKNLGIKTYVQEERITLDDNIDFRCDI